MIVETLFWYFDFISFYMNGCPKRIRKASILLILFTVYYAYGHTTLSIPVLVWSLKSSRVGPCQYLDGWLPRNTWCCRLYFLIFRLSLFIDKWLSVRINKLTMTLLQELRNSNYSNTRPGIADLVSELMVVCQWTHDRLDSFLIFRIYLILYECVS